MLNLEGTQQIYRTHKYGIQRVQLESPVEPTGCGLVCRVSLRWKHNHLGSWGRPRNYRYCTREIHLIGAPSELQVLYEEIHLTGAPLNYRYCTREI